VILYVCGPMSGLPEFNYPAFMAAEAVLTEAGYEVQNPARVDERHDGTNCRECRVGRRHNWEWYMDQCLPMVDLAEGLAVLPGWQHSRGAKIEVERALSHGLYLATVPTWVARRRTALAGRLEP
jgi:hypothetical protein